MNWADRALLVFALALFPLLPACTPESNVEVTQVKDGDSVGDPTAAQVKSETPGFPAIVTRVKDGDSLIVTQDSDEIDIRLEGIDCPELAQTFGTQAKQATSLLCDGKTVTIQPTGTDRYGRTLATVILPDGTNLNQELVRQGYAWWFYKYSDDQTLAKLEAESRKECRGLWVNANPTAPWDWRDQQRNRGRQPALDVKVVPSGVEIVALLPNPKGEDQGHEQVVIGNRNATAVDLAGWKLQDRANNMYSLSGTVPANGKLRVPMTDPSMPLNNNGDEILLIDQGGVVRSQVAYGEYEVRSGQWVEFEQEQP